MGEVIRFRDVREGEPMVDAQAFAAWLAARLSRYEQEAERESRQRGLTVSRRGGVVKRLAAELGISERNLRHYRECTNAEGIPVATFPLAHVIRLLDHAEVPVWEVYPDIEQDGELHDRWCRSCKDLVTTGPDKVCPWCEGKTEARGRRERRWCERCDRLVYPADDGTCWMCGVKCRRRAPDVACECGCGEYRPRFDQFGRRATYVRGHASRALERDSHLDVAPFRAWLIAELRTLDPVEALCARTKLTRGEVQAVLNGRVEAFPRSRITRALWCASRMGTVGKGAPMRPGATKLHDLYPVASRTRVCPDCGGGKAPHAERCKDCRRKHERASGEVRAGVRQTAIGEHVMEEARRMYDAGATFVTLAHVLFERVPHTSIESLAQTFSREFDRRGWKRAA